MGGGGKGIFASFSLTDSQGLLPLGLSIRQSLTTSLFRSFPKPGLVTTLDEPEHVYISTTRTRQSSVFSLSLNILLTFRQG